MKNKGENNSFMGVVIFIGIILFGASLFMFYFVSSDEELSEESGLSMSEVMKVGDVSLCYDLDDENLIPACVNKLSVCQNDTCFYNNARMSSDVSMCYNISDESMAAACSMDVRDSNLRTRAVNEDDVSVCDEFGREELVSHCKDNYYYVKSVNEQNKEFCESILNVELKNECKKR